LLNTIDLTTPFDLDGDGATGGIRTEEINRTDVGEVLTADEHEVIFQDPRLVGQQHLEVCLNSVLL
jgi:hypothetical protein